MADFSQPAGTVIGQTIGNTLEVLIAALLFYRLAEGRTQFGRVRDVAALVGAAAAGTAVSAVFGAASLPLGGVIPSGQVGRSGGRGFSATCPARSCSPPAAVLGRRADRRDHVASGIGGRGYRDADRRARAASLTAGRAVHRVSGPDLGGASLGSPRSSGRGGAGDDPHRLQHRTSRRAVRASDDHPEPARHAAVRGLGGADLAGARRGHRRAPRGSGRAAPEGAAPAQVPGSDRQGRRRRAAQARAQPARRRATAPGVTRADAAAGEASTQRTTHRGRAPPDRGIGGAPACDRRAQRAGPWDPPRSALRPGPWTRPRGPRRSRTFPRRPEADIPAASRHRWRPPSTTSPPKD